MLIKKLSIVIPVYNEKNTIAELLNKVEAVDLGAIEKEIIIVDDGSKDGTRDILKNFENKYKVICQPKNMGKGAAVRAGFAVASGDFVVIQDADLEYDPNDFKKMLALAGEKNADVIYGSRRLGSAGKKNEKAGWSYYLGGVFLSFLTNLLYGTKITDEPTCYKMVSKKVLDKIKLEADGFEFCPEITAKICRLKIPIYEVPISYFPRSAQEGKKIKWKDGFIAVWTLIKNRKNYL